MIAYLNGAFLDETEAKVSVFDRGFLYGDTVYETIRTVGGEPLFWTEHERRFRRSCELAAYEIEWSRVDLPSIFRRLLDSNGLLDARIRLTLSRGIGGPDQLNDFRHTWVVTARPFEPPTQEQYRTGVAAVLVGVSRNDRGALDPEIKSGNFLNNLLARREARLRGAAEGIMRNPEGLLAEGSMSNLFWVRQGVLETPPVAAGLLPGVTREKVLALAGASLGREPAVLPAWPELARPIPGLSGATEVLARPDRLRDAEEIFLTSTSLEVLAIADWEGAPVGSGRPGPVAAELRERLRMLYPGARRP